MNRRLLHAFLLAMISLLATTTAHAHGDYSFLGELYLGFIIICLVVGSALGVVLVFALRNYWRKKDKSISQTVTTPTEDKPEDEPIDSLGRILSFARCLLLSLFSGAIFAFLGASFVYIVTGYDPLRPASFVFTFSVLLVVGLFVGFRAAKTWPQGTFVAQLGTMVLLGIIGGIIADSRSSGNEFAIILSLTLASGLGFAAGFIAARKWGQPIVLASVLTGTLFGSLSLIICFGSKYAAGIVEVVQGSPVSLPVFIYDNRAIETVLLTIVGLVIGMVASRRLGTNSILISISISVVIGLVGFLIALASSGSVYFGMALFGACAFVLSCLTTICIYRKQNTLWSILIAFIGALVVGITGGLFAGDLHLEEYIASFIFGGLGYAAALAITHVIHKTTHRALKVASVIVFTCSILVFCGIVVRALLFVDMTEIIRYGSLNELEAALQDIDDVDERDKHGSTPIMIAITYTCDFTKINALISAGSDVNALNSYGKSALHLAAGDRCSCPENKKLKIIDLLVEHGADVNAAGYNGNTPLMFATHKAVIKRLIELGAAVNARNNADNTPLHLAIEKRNCKAIVLALLEAGAMVNAQNDKGNTPLHLAVQQSNCKETVGVARTLLESGADPQLKDIYGNSTCDFFTEENELRALLKCTTGAPSTEWKPVPRIE